MSNVIFERLNKLREKMKENNCDWYLITSEDYHGSEYISDYFKVREYFTGFSGDNAILVLNDKEAWMWTDGRFFIQAEKELEGTTIQLMKMGEENVPKVPDFLKSNVKKGESLFFDGRTISSMAGKRIESKLLENEAIVISYKDLTADIITDRKPLPCSKAFYLTDEESGENTTSKLKRVRDELNKEEADAFFLSKLDDICWLTNLRGDDIACNPVLLSYFYMDEKENILFIQDEELSDEVKKYLSKVDIKIRDYFDAEDFLKGLCSKKRVLADCSSINFLLSEIISKNSVLINKKNPTTLLKAVKNEVEMKRLRECILKDSAVVTKFIYWLKSNIGKIEISEISASDYLDNLRSEVEGFLGLSFPTISGYGENAAMMHYEATKEKFSVCRNEGFLLVDSGGQYKNGTTDITRTIALGPLSDKQKLHFSKVAAGMLSIADAKFLYGCTGRNLDILARLPLWKLGIDYKCGTGHGVGYILNVHEGPHSLRWMYNKDIEETILEENMIVTDEPGVYIEGEYGIRTENEIVVVKDEKNSDGQFMRFEHLTYTPIDRDALDKKYLSDEDIERINDYHSKVYELTKDFMNKEEKEWLYEVTRPL